MRVGIVAQKGNERAVAVAADVRDALAEAGVETWLDSATADALGREGAAVSGFDGCDLVVSIGGDGTFLFAARHAGTVPVLGVNLGEVGFLNAVPPGEAVAAVEREVARFRDEGRVRSTEMPRIRASGPDWSLTPAINEVVVQAPQRGRGQGLSAAVDVDGEAYLRSHADGVLAATPTGSTAYNLSEGGPLVHPSVPGLVVAGMCAADPMPPLVVPADAAVSVRVEGAAALAVADGSSVQELDPPATVTLSAAEPARVAGPGVEFFEALGKLD